MQIFYFLYCALVLLHFWISIFSNANKQKITNYSVFYNRASSQDGRAASLKYLLKRKHACQISFPPSRTFGLQSELCGRFLESVNAPSDLSDSSRVCFPSSKPKQCVCWIQIPCFFTALFHVRIPLAQSSVFRGL